MVDANNAASCGISQEVQEKSEQRINPQEAANTVVARVRFD
ncbi:MAG: hypothetical protein P4K83_10460 [Terracidiphilus sp.]|nr:hypothetical protein [Terracidiphilus sp.]